MKYPKIKSQSKRTLSDEDQIKKDPKLEFRKSVVISLIVLSIGLSQLGIVIAGRSWLIWSTNESPKLSGNDEIYVPGTLLLPDRYLITVLFYIPTLWTPDLVGNITFSHLSSGRNYTFSYHVNGYMSYKLVDHDVISLVLLPGRYNVTWTNNLDDYSYTLTTHGLLNFFPKEGFYPYVQENVWLIVSIFIALSLLVGAIRRFLKGKRAYAYHK